MHPELRKEIEASSFCGRSSILDMIDNFDLRQNIRYYVSESDDVSIDWKYLVRVNVIVRGETRWEPIYRALRKHFNVPHTRLSVHHGSIDAEFRNERLQHIYFSASFPECKVTVLREAVEAQYKIECGSDDLEQQVRIEDALSETVDPPEFPVFSEVTISEAPPAGEPPDDAADTLMDDIAARASEEYNNGL